MASRMLSRALRGCMPLRTIQGQQTRNMSAAATQAATKGAGENQSHDHSQSQAGGDIARQHQSRAPQQQQQRQRGVGRRANFDSFLPMVPGGLFDLWSPLSSSRSMRQMMDSMNRLVDMDFFPAESGMRGSSGLRTPWDIVEKDESYYMRIDMPGFEKSDLKIYAEDDELVIQAEKKAEEDDLFGMQRSVNTRMLLPQEAVKDKIKAELKNGVLTVVVPKEQVPENKKQVQVNIE